jgi:hypothetical protein
VAKNTYDFQAGVRDFEIVIDTMSIVTFQFVHKRSKQVFDSINGWKLCALGLYQEGRLSSIFNRLTIEGNWQKFLQAQIPRACRLAVGARVVDASNKRKRGQQLSKRQRRGFKRASALSKSEKARATTLSLRRLLPNRRSLFAWIETNLLWSLSLLEIYA